MLRFSICMYVKIRGQMSYFSVTYGLESVYSFLEFVDAFQSNVDIHELTAIT